MSPGGNNIALIGMPGAGKSTLGVLLAKRTARGFVDTDLRIQVAESSALREIIEKRGVDAFRGIEERTIEALDCSGCVIATGGSVIYSETSMRHLGRLGVRVYLEVSLAELERRLGDLGARGVVRAPGQKLPSLLEERRPLYERWADLRVDCASLSPDAALETILAALAAGGS